MKKNIDDIHPLVMAEEFWKDSPLSTAKYYGGARLDGNLYVIVNKEGKTLFECSVGAYKQNWVEAIPAGEPADLCLMQLVPVYRWLGREELMKRLINGVKPSVLLDEYKKSKKGARK